MESTAGYFLSFAAHKIRRVEEAKKLAKVTVVKSQGKSSLEKKNISFTDSLRRNTSEERNFKMGKWLILNQTFIDFYDFLIQVQEN